MDIGLYKIKPEELAGKGVVGQPNPMEKTVAEAQAVFDQLSREILIPKLNGLIDGLAPLDLVGDLDKPISTAVQNALDTKVDKAFRTGSKVTYKVLSDNNYSDIEKDKVKAATEEKHIHGNMEVLNTITPENITDWQGGNVLTKDNVTPYEPTGRYNPATVEYVDKKVVAIGAADMTKSVYDPNSKGQDIFAYADNSRIMVDENDGRGYMLGVRDGALFYKEVEEGFKK